MPADDVDGKAERALGPAQEFARIVRHAECIGSHRSHRRRVQSRKTFTKPRQALERRLHSDRRDPAIGVEARPETQGFSPGVLPIDLISLDTADFQPEAVRSQVDDGEGGQRHERHTVAAEARRLAENWHVSATLGAFSRMRSRHADRLPAKDPHCQGLRRRHRIVARSGAHVVSPHRQSGAAEARGSAARVFVQASRRLQQDGAFIRGRARARCGRRIGGQPRAGSRAGRSAPVVPGDHRHAGNYPVDQDRRGGGPWRDRCPARRFLQRCLFARAQIAAERGRYFRPPVR